MTGVEAFFAPIGAIGTSGCRADRRDCSGFYAVERLYSLMKNIC